LETRRLISAVASEVTGVAREAGTEGKLGGQAVFAARSHVLQKGRRNAAITRATM